MKHPAQSKTIWVNVITLLLVKLWPSASRWVSENPESFTAAYALANIALRFITTELVVWSKKGLGAALIFLLVGCASQMQVLDPTTFYKRDLALSINGIEHVGVGVVKAAGNYEIIVKPRSEIALLLIRSCHREDAFEKISPGWFGNNQFKYQYKPEPGLEIGRVCPLRIDTYDSKQGQNSWAFVEIEDAQYRLPFRVTCNGSDSAFTGVGTCQSKRALVQKIQFNEPVRFAPPLPDNCAKPKKVGDAYEVEASLGECLYIFDSQDGKLGRLVLIGYDGILVRSAQ